MRTVQRQFRANTAAVKKKLCRGLEREEGGGGGGESFI